MFLSSDFLFYQRRHALQANITCVLHRVLNPDRAVLVKGGNAILGCDILGIGLVVGHLLDESQDGLFGGAVVPRWQWGPGLSRWWPFGTALRGPCILYYEAAQVARRIRAGELETPYRSLDSSLKTMATLDMIRHAVGIDFSAAGSLE